MSFPYNVGKRFNVVAALTDTKSAIVGDIQSKVIENPDGKNFVINFDGGFMQYDTKDKEWTIHGTKIYLGDNANDPVVRRSDLQAVVDIFNNHVHVVAGTAAEKTATSARANGSTKVFAK